MAKSGLLNPARTPSNPSDGRRGLQLLEAVGWTPLKRVSVRTRELGSLQGRFTQAIHPVFLLGCCSIFLTALLTHSKCIEHDDSVFRLRGHG